jgi:hypothetical protein
MLFTICMNARPDVDKKTRKAAMSAAEDVVLRLGVF